MNKHDAMIAMMGVAGTNQRAFDLIDKFVYQVTELPIEPLKRKLPPLMTEQEYKENLTENGLRYRQRMRLLGLTEDPPSYEEYVRQQRLMEQEYAAAEVPEVYHPVFPSDWSGDRIGFVACAPSQMTANLYARERLCLVTKTLTVETGVRSWGNVIEVLDTSCHRATMGVLLIYCMQLADMLTTQQEGTASRQAAEAARSMINRHLGAKEHPSEVRVEAEVAATEFVGDLMTAIVPRLSLELRRLPSGLTIAEATARAAERVPHLVGVYSQQFIIQSERELIQMLELVGNVMMLRMLGTKKFKQYLRQLTLVEPLPPVAQD